MPLIALNHLRDIGTGDTRPQLFSCDHDGRRERWVLKLMGLSGAELAADWIGSLLAHRVGLPCPEVAIASVSAEALATAPEAVRQWARPGPGFASAFVEGVTHPIGDAAMVRFHAGVLGAMYALDAWLEVLDRRKPDGIWNVLKREGDGQLVVLDFGKGLTPCLQFVIGAGEEPIAPAYPDSVRHVASLETALETCAMIQAIDDNDLGEVVASVPPQWLDAATRECITRFLRDRSGRVRAVCEQWLS